MGLHCAPPSLIGLLLFCFVFWFVGIKWCLDLYPNRSITVTTVSTSTCSLDDKRKYGCPEIPSAPAGNAGLSRANTPEQLARRLKSDKRLSSNFRIYNGVKGFCSAQLQIQRISGSIIEDAFLLCAGNNNCTFVTHHQPTQTTILCSGRDGTNSLPTIKVSPSSFHAEWISADRKGCEDFDSIKAIQLHKEKSLPKCHEVHEECSVRSRVDGMCLPKLLKLEGPDGWLRAHKGDYVCHHPKFGLQFTSQLTRPMCAWRESTNGQRRDFINKQTGARLFVDILRTHVDDASLRKPPLCLCNNPTGGLVSGPYCGNQDCIWQSSPREDCMFTNKQSGQCLTWLFRNPISIDSTHGKPPDNVLNACLCADVEYGVWVERGLCASPQCSWRALDGVLVNVQTELRLTDMILNEGDGSLVTTLEECMCHLKNDSLVLAPICGAAECVWDVRGLLTNLQSLPESQFFQLQENVLHHCAMQLQPVLRTGSIQEAMQLCLNEPQCTFMAYNAQDRSTLLCNGHFTQHDHFSADFKYWYSAVRKGCNKHIETRAFTQLADAERVSCYKQLQCSCPPGTMLVQACGVDTHAVCDVCNHGFCPVWKDMQMIPAFQDPLQALSGRLTLERNSTAAFRAFNPGIFLHTTSQRVFSTFRIANNSYCSKYDMTGQVHSTYSSHIGLCELNTTTLTPRPRSCREITFSFGLVQSFQDLEEHPVFRGVEDIRSIDVNGTLYLVGTLSLYKRTSLQSGMDYMLPALLLVDKEWKSASKAVVLHDDSTPQRISQKNWMPLVTEDGLYFVTFARPFTVVRPNMSTGHVEVVHRSWLSQDLDSDLSPHMQLVFKLGHLRGGTNFVYIGNDEYMSVIHRRIDYRLGPIYTHHLFVVEHKNRMFKMKWMSDSFRMPDAPESPTQDVQFASGLHRHGDDLLLAFGVADCHAFVGVIKNFQPLLARMRKGEDVFGAAAQLVADKQPAMVRWEGPLQDFSSFAIVARALGLRLLKHATKQLDFQWADTSIKVAFDVTNITELLPLGEHLIANNSVGNIPPTVTIRMAWPPNLNPPLSQFWVQYIPWEFYHIPDEWVAAMGAHANEVWVPSEYNRQGYISSGIAADKVVVVPHGVDAQRVCLDGELASSSINTTLNLDFKGKFVFMFRGGALWRKGLDILLKAYLGAFTAEDPVVLLLHVIYGDKEVYSMLKSSLRQAMSNKHSPTVRLITHEVSEAEVRLMYAVTHAYVHPARAEGYGLTIAESMACGLPVIVPDKGGHADFVNNKTGFLVKAKSVVCNKPPCRPSSTKGQPHLVFDMKMAKPPQWVETDATDFGRMMRYVWSNPDERNKRRLAAKEYIRTQVTWEAAAKVGVKRLNGMVGSNQTSKQTVQA